MVRFLVLESRAMKTRAAAIRLLLLLWVATILAACGHARVVRVEPQARREVYGRTAPTPRPVAPTPAPAPARVEPRPVPRDAMVTVQAGDTLFGIARRFGLRYQDVAEWNGIDAPYSIRVGQRLRLAPPAVADAAEGPAPAPAATIPAPPPAAPAAATSTADSPVASAAAASAPPVATATPPAPTLPAATPDRAPVVSTGGLRWRWPTRGQVIGRFVAGDPTQQGVNIAGKAGQPVVAAADGVVVYSGAGLVGYGELIIIKHSDEWLSAYAHNRRRLVAEGAQVKAGDVIAELGSTGAPRDMLHFEIRRNGRPVDPQQYLPAP